MKAGWKLCRMPTLLTSSECMAGIDRISKMRQSSAQQIAKDANTLPPLTQES